MTFPHGEERLLRAGESLAVSHLIEGVKLSPDATNASMIAVLIDLLEPASAIPV
jgi:hypothetical protein